MKWLRILALFALPAGATSMAPLALPQLAAAADRIAVARVERQVAEWTAGGSAIVTRVTLRVEQAVKGKLRAGERLEVLSEGGEVAGAGMLIEGAARFTPGEVVLVFLEQRGAGSWTVGMAQGALHVETRNGERTVRRDLAGLRLLGPAAPVPRTLDEVLSAIAASAPEQR